MLQTLSRERNTKKNDTLGNHRLRLLNNCKRKAIYHPSHAHAQAATGTNLWEVEGGCTPHVDGEGARNHETKPCSVQRLT